MRSYLGASSWSHCDRKMWLTYRQAFNVEVSPERKIARKLGNAAEDIVIEVLEERGYKIGGKQKKLVGKCGQTIAKIDGAVLSPDGRKQLLEIKSVKNKVFKDIMKNGLPDYYQAQIQIEMHHSDQITQDSSKIDETLYMVLNRDSCELVDFVVEYIPLTGEVETERMHRIMEADDMPPADESFKCNFCDNKEFCKFGKLPNVTCRTCANVELNDGRFECPFGDSACDKHLIHPAFMLAIGCEIESADRENLAIDYGNFVHGPVGYKHSWKDTFSSQEYVEYFKSREKVEDE